jgi:hypothetical protein
VASALAVVLADGLAAGAAAPVAAALVDPVTSDLVVRDGLGCSRSRLTRAARSASRSARSVLSQQADVWSGSSKTTRKGGVSRQHRSNA